MKRLTIKSLMICIFVSIGLCIGFTALSIGQNVTTEAGSTNETPWDVNQDRVVNVLDLVIVGQNFGTNNPVADVTGDGTVNILDLVLVAQHFGETIPEPEPIAQYIYWTEWGSGKIRRANLDGSNVVDIVDTGYFPVGIAIDLSGGKLYWTDKTSNNHSDPNATNRVARANLDGTNIEVLFSESNTADSIFTYFQIVLDSTEGKIYWSKAIATPVEEGAILRADLDGSNVEEIITGLGRPADVRFVGPRGLTLDLSIGKLYWGHCGTGKIQRANLDGSNVEDIITGQVCVQDVEFDVSGETIYWADYGEVYGKGSIHRANLDGSNAEELASGYSNPHTIVFDSFTNKIYWTSHGDGSIYRANHDGSNIERIISGLGRPVYLALDVPSQ